MIGAKLEWVYSLLKIFEVKMRVVRDVVLTSNIYFKIFKELEEVK